MNQAHLAHTLFNIKINNLETQYCTIIKIHYYYNLLTAEVYNIQLPIYGAWYKNILKIGWGQKSRRHYKLVYILIIGAFSAAAHIFRFYN